MKNIIFLLLIVCIYSCKKENVYRDNMPENSVFNGNISLWTNNFKPVKNPVTVKLHGYKNYETVSDASGFFSISGIALGSYYAEVIAGSDYPVIKTYNIKMNGLDTFSRSYGLQMTAKHMVTGLPVVSRISDLTKIEFPVDAPDSLDTSVLSFQVYLGTDPSLSYTNYDYIIPSGNMSTAAGVYMTVTFSSKEYYTCLLYTSRYNQSGYDEGRFYRSALCNEPPEHTAYRERRYDTFICQPPV